MPSGLQHPVALCTCLKLLALGDTKHIAMRSVANSAEPTWHITITLVKDLTGAERAVGVHYHIAEHDQFGAMGVDLPKWQVAQSQFSTRE